MKKIVTLAVMMMLGMNAVLSQIINDTIFFPNHVTGRYINSSGEVTTQYPADFHYDSEGMLSSFEVPYLHLTSQLVYDNHYLNNITTHWYYNWGYGQDYTWDEVFEFENGLIQTELHQEFEATFENYDRDYLFYYYNEDGQLIRKEQGYTPNNICDIWTYTYDDQGKTNSVFYYISWGCQGLTQLSGIYDYQYEDGLLQEILIEEYDDVNHNYDTWFTKKQVYSYTEDGKLASEIKQDLVDGEWINNTIHINLYDAYGKIIEQQEGIWSESLNDWDITKKVIHEYSMTNMTYTVSFYKKSGENWVWDSFRNQKLFFDSELKWQQKELENFWAVNQFEFTLTYLVHSTYFEASEWYYEIENEDGNITYQHLEYASDTTINNDKAKVIVRTNQIYDKDGHIETTHEYIKEDDNKVYWWNKEIHEFTMLYDFDAEVGDEWVIKVGQESVTVHVDQVGVLEYEDESYKLLSISDAGHVFDGDIICGIGHTASFFPERLMNHRKDYDVNGLRCYWLGKVLVYHNGDKNCDEVYEQHHHGVDETDLADGIRIYPNPTDGLLHIVRLSHCGSPMGQTEYRITNLLGQTLSSGILTEPTIDASSLPTGMYFLNFGGQAVKFIKE